MSNDKQLSNEEITVLVKTVMELAEILKDKSYNNFVFETPIMIKGNKTNTIAEPKMPKWFELWNQKVFLPVIKDIHHRIDQVEDRLNKRINEVEDRLNRRINEVEYKINKRIDQVEDKINKRIDQVEDGLNKRIDQVENRLNKRIDSVEDKINIRINEVEYKLNNKINNAITNLAKRNNLKI